MTRYVVHALLNTAEHNFDGFHDQWNDLATEHRLSFTVEAVNPLHAAEALWPVGNKQAADADGKEWPHTVRSLSVGDVLYVESVDGLDAPRLYAVAGAGLTEVQPPLPFAAYTGALKRGRTVLAERKHAAPLTEEEEEADHVWW